MEVRVTHRLDPAEATRRIRAAAQELEIRPDGSENEGDPHGVFTKDTPLGSIRASWEVLPGEVVVRIESKPAFLPASTVTRALEEGLAKTLSD